MQKSEAIALLGGTPTKAAEAVGVTPAAISLWPATLPPRIADRVQAALWRMEQAQKAADAPALEGEARDLAHLNTTEAS